MLDDRSSDMRTNPTREYFGYGYDLMKMAKVCNAVTDLVSTSGSTHRTLHGTRLRRVK